jgi:acetyl-CoA carboxylase carboxyl transferase subunit beta
MQGDLIIAEPGALIGFAGPRVIEQTIGSKLPEGCQRAEFQLEHGFADLLCERNALHDTLAALLRLHQHPVREVNGRTEVGGGAYNLSTSVPLPTPKSPRLTPQQHLELARASTRPHVRDFIGKIFDDFIELHGDRVFGDDHALIAGLASFEGIAVTVAGHVKGSDLNSNIAANFGMPHPEGYRKFVRLAKQAAKFGRPIITFIDTPGAYPGIEAEQRGQGEAIAYCLHELSTLAVPVIAIVTGEGGSGGALALGVADRIAMLEHAVYSVISPEGFASILWKDASRAAEASALMKITAADLYDFGMIDAIIPELGSDSVLAAPVASAPSAASAAAAAPAQSAPPAASAPHTAHTDSAQAPELVENNELFATVRTFLRNSLTELLPLSGDELVAQRYQRFRRF